MARRKSRPYIVDLGYPKPHQVPADWWRHFVAQGWLIPTSKRAARLRPGIIVRFVNGMIRLLDFATEITASIPSSWRMIERCALYAMNGPRLSAEGMQREIWAQYGR